MSDQDGGLRDEALTSIQVLIDKARAKIAYDRLAKLREASETPEEFANSFMGEMGTPEFDKKLEASLKKTLYAALGLRE